MSELNDLQVRIYDWTRRTFGIRVADDRRERVTRLLEEVVELAQAEDMKEFEIDIIVSHVFSKPKGDPKLEAAQVGVTWLAYCACVGAWGSLLVKAEANRIFAIPIEVWEARHAAKVAKGIAARRCACAQADCPDCSP